MSVFRNLTDADLWLQGPNDERKSVRGKAEFSGSNFYKRYTRQWAKPGDPILLEMVSDDNVPYNTSTPIPNILKSWEFVVSPGEDWSDHLFDFEDPEVLGSNALFVQIMVDDSPVSVKINGNEDSVFRMDADSTQIFNTNELLVSQIAFKNLTVSGGLSANIRLSAAAISQS